MWPRIINTGLGAWMMVVPTLFAYQKTEADNAYIFGALIISNAIIAMAESVRNVRFLNLVIGIWLILAPWILSFDTTAAKVNDPAVGLMVISMSLIKGRIRERLGGGWAAIFRKNQ